MVRQAIMDALYTGGSELETMVLLSSGSEFVNAAGQLTFIPSASLRTIQEGDILLTEFDAIYYGYRGQLNQPFAAVRADIEWKDMAEVCKESYENGIKALRDGISVGELENRMIQPIQEAGYNRGTPLFHGIDYLISEPFSTFPLQPDEVTLNTFKIRAGMVLELEPHVATQDMRKGMQLGSELLVTRDGCAPLGRNWKPELMII